MFWNVQGLAFRPGVAMSQACDAPQRSHPMGRASEAGHEGYKPQLLQPVFKTQDELVAHENISVAEASPTVEEVMSHLLLGDFSLEYHLLLETKCSNT